MSASRFFVLITMAYMTFTVCRSLPYSSCTFFGCISRGTASSYMGCGAGGTKKRTVSSDVGCMSVNGNGNGAAGVDDSAPRD